MTWQARKLHKSLVAIGVCGLILFTPSVSLAWGPEAHKIIAYIGYDELKPNAKKKILELLLPPGSKVSALEKAFVDASTWADDIRVTRPEFNQEHFIDKTFPTNSTPPEPNLLTALTKRVEVLRSSTTNQNEKAEALKFIIHYVGDIHQPLHCATRTSEQYPNGDAGANRFRIMVADSGGKLRTISLHSYWDRGLDSFSLSTFTVRKAADTAEKAYPKRDPNTPAATFNFQSWADDSFKLAQVVAYAGVKDGERVSVNYRVIGILTMNIQLAKAGYRLGALLNAIFP